MKQRIKSAIIEAIEKAAMTEAQQLPFQEQEPFVGVRGVKSVDVEGHGYFAVTLDDGSKGVFYVTVREARA